MVLYVEVMNFKSFVPEKEQQMRINPTKCCCLLMKINFSVRSELIIDIKDGFDIVSGAVVLLTASIAAVSVSVWRAG